MARIIPHNIDPSPGRLSLEELHEGSIEVFYVPHKKRLKAARLDEEHPEKYKTKILTINAKDHNLEIWPINTFPEKSDFLQPKYTEIKSITLDNYELELPATEQEVMYILEDLPSGFIKDFDYGLGLQKDYRFIIKSIENIGGIKHLVLKDDVEGEISQDGEFCFISDRLFNKIRKEINGITTKAQGSARVVKTYVTHNLVAYHLKNDQYPMKPLKIGNSSLEKMIARADPDYEEELTQQEQTKVIDLVSRNKSSIAKKQPDTLLKLQNDLELVSLETLIEKYQDMIGKRLGEDKWQDLFSANPFILSLAFGYPAIKIQDQAFVGGRKLSGKGDKVTDFLTKNALTNNACIFEIKKPGSVLLNKKEYREGVFSPSSEFSGALTQLSDQIHKFQKEIATIKENTKIYDIETFAVHGVLVIGVTPEELERQKSFELFRNNSKNISVITFDELLEKLKQLHAFLSQNEQDES